MIRKIFVADGPDQKPATISEYLSYLITEVFTDVERGGFHVDVFNLKGGNYSDPTIRWFVSSTLEPVVYGMTDFSTGISIGVPISYNYEEPGDIPDELFAIKRLALFRSLGEEKQEQHLTEEELALTKPKKDLTVTVREIDKSSQEGKDYTESLLLSENAKKFSLAKELYVGDSYRPLLHFTNIALATTGANVVSRAQVKYFKLSNSHITQRMPGYFLSGLLFFGLYTLMSEAIDEATQSKACKRAKNLGDDYAAGADEYFRKRAVRDKILGIDRSRYFYS